MQFLSRDEVASFLEAKEANLVLLESMRQNLKPDDLYFIWPEETGKVLTATRSIVHFKKKADWTLVIVEATGIWPSWEDRNLYDLLRKAHGGRKEWAYGEGHLFEADETLDLVTFVTVLANFRWDFRVLDSNNDFQMFASHDDYVIIRAPNIAESLWVTLTNILKKSEG
jgi:hypothetical protein